MHVERFIENNNFFIGTNYRGNTIQFMNILNDHDDHKFHKLNKTKTNTELTFRPHFKKWLITYLINGFKKKYCCFK